MSVTATRGLPLPFGPSPTGARAFNIAVHARIERLALRVYAPHGGGRGDVMWEGDVSAKTGDVWHIELLGIEDGWGYVLVVHGRELVDPWARFGMSWGPEAWMKRDRTGGRMGLFAPGVAVREFDWGEDDNFGCTNRPWERLVLYEAHVRALSQRGTFREACTVVPYLKWLGITAVQLMPIFEFDELEGQARNVWGYSPNSWFIVMNRFGGAQELMMLVRELHRNGIEAILDVVYNHSGHAPCPLHFLNTQGSYYMRRSSREIGLDKSPHFPHSNISGCGNTMAPNNPLMLELIVQSMRHFVAVFHIDGFRIDAAGVLCRDATGRVLDAPAVIHAIADDPILKDRRLIVEGWDAGDQVGSPNMLLGSAKGFPRGDRFCEWNASWRDAMRRFVSGEKSSSRGFCKAFRGSPEFWGKGRQMRPSRPLGSHHGINFIACHDGLTLADLVSYKNRTNNDGYDEVSFNCGKEGSTDDVEVLALRARQMRNLVLCLALSRGVPMLACGDELAFSKLGNSNTWNDASHAHAALPARPEECSNQEHFVRFTRHCLMLRQRFVQLTGPDFHSDIQWLNVTGKPRSGSSSERRKSGRAFKADGSDNIVAFLTRPDSEGRSLYGVFNNSSTTEYDLVLPSSSRWSWTLLINTASRQWSGELEETSIKSQSGLNITPNSAQLLVGTI